MERAGESEEGYTVPCSLSLANEEVGRDVRQLKEIV